MTAYVASVLVVLQALLLLVGTQMPGAWRSSLINALHWPLELSSLAHLLLFAGMAAVAVAKPLQWSVLRIAAMALALAVLTEGLQFFALDRHPQLCDVGIDMVGALLGVGFIRGSSQCFFRR